MWYNMIGCHRMYRDMMIIEYCLVYLNTSVCLSNYQPIDLSAVDYCTLTCACFSCDSNHRASEGAYPINQWSSVPVPATWKDRARLVDGVCWVKVRKGVGCVDGGSRWRGMLGYVKEYGQITEYMNSTLQWTTRDYYKREEKEIIGSSNYRSLLFLWRWIWFVTGNCLFSYTPQYINIIIHATVSTFCFDGNAISYPTLCACFWNTQGT